MINPKVQLYFHTPVPVFKARVNMGTITFPLTSITFDGVTLGAYTDIEEDMTVLLGTTEGADDLGRTRVKGTPTSSILPLPRTSKGVTDGSLVVTDDAYITVLKDFRPWAKIPFFAENGNGTDYKDGTVEVGDYNTHLPPVANTGPFAAGTVDSGTGLLTVQFPAGGASLSYAMADGATIASYAWDVDGGTITVGSASDAVITATFPAGSYWVALTVVDSNGKPHTSRCFVLAIDPDLSPMQKNYQIQQSLEWQGQTLDIDIHKPISRANYPDGTLVLLLWDEPIDESDRDNIKFVGWLDTEHYSVGRSKPGIKRTTTLHAIDMGGWLNKLPGFAQALYREEEKDEHDNTISPWSYMPSLDMKKALWYFGFWHSTAFGIADLGLPATGGDYDTMRLDGGANTLFQQMTDLAQKMVPDHYLTVNTLGQLDFKRDWRLDDLADRPDVEVTIGEDSWNNLAVDYERHPKFHVLRSGAVLASTAYESVDGEDTLPLVFSIAPGDAAAFGQGPLEQAENEGLALSQDDLNKSEGHRWAMINSYWGDFSFEDPTRSVFWSYQPAAFRRVTLSWDSAYAPFRDLPFTEVTGLVKTINVSYTTDQRGTAIKVSVTLTKEEVGYPATTYVPDDTEPVGWTPPPGETTPPTDGLITGQNLVAGLSRYHLYVTENFQDSSPNWVKKALASSTSDKIMSWVADPFSAGYVNQTGVGSIDGFYVTHDKIYKVTDIFGSATKSTLLTFGTDAAGATHWRTIQATFGRFFDTESDNPWLICVSYYGNTGGHAGTWATKSVDGGVTWSTEVQISANYDSGITSFQPIGLYLSPKVPGFAYTVAHIETGSPANCAFFQTTDYGDTWNVIATTADPTKPAPFCGSFVDTNASTTKAQAYTALGKVPSLSIFRSDAGSGNIFYDDSLGIAPPANAKRITISGVFTGYKENHGFGSTAYSFSFGKNGTFVTKSTISDTNNGLTAYNDTYVREFTFQYDFSDYLAHDWPDNSDDLEVDPSPADSDFAIYFRINISSNATTSHNASASLTLTIDEIILDDGTTYAPQLGVLDPIHGQAGAIHIPWPDNDDEGVIFYGSIDRSSNRLIRLNRVVAGAVDQVGPTVSAKEYGVHHGHFSIRTHDSDRSHVLLAGKANESSSAESSDKCALFGSGDGGDTWNTLISPINYTDTLYGLFAAFGSDDPDEIFVWGGYNVGSNCIQYATDGSTFSDKQGDLDSLVEGTYGNIAFLGIAGGPIGG